MAINPFYRGYSKALIAKYSTPPAPKLPSIYGGGGGGGYVAPPKLDVASLSAQARQQAEGAVNPYYTLQLNRFLEQQSTQRQQQQTQTKTDIKNIEDTLKDTLEGNLITKTRTGEDVALNQQQIATQADEFQTDTGTQFATDRLALAKQAAGGGGLSQQAGETAQAKRTTGETRQVQKFQEATKQQDLFKTRTFEDLARSGKLAGTAAEKGKKQAKFDLDTYIQNQGLTEKSTRDQIEKARQDEILQKQGAFSKKAFADYIARIVNPAQIVSANQKYGAYF